MNTKRSQKITSVVGAVLTLLAFPALPGRASPDELAATDSAISSAVEEDLNFEKGVSPNFLDVKTTNGIVTLSGSVDNILAKARAVRIAESIRSVLGVIDQIVVTPVSRPDEDIRKDILMALLQDPATESYQIVVAVKDAVVTLTGSVGSWAESQLAARVANGVKGVKKLENDLTINYSGKRTAAEMAADIRARLEWDIWVNNGLITANVSNGTAILTGSVGSVLVKSRAMDDAWVNGVTAVDASGLKVVPWMRDELRRHRQFVTKPDSDVKHAVEAALRYDPRVSPFSPDVRVEDGAVILGGLVGNLKAKTAAADDAMDTVGVGWVDNLLKVRPKKLPADAEVEKVIQAAIQWDPVLEGIHIEVAVINHVAYLSGTVDWNNQKREAQDVATRTTGVLEVRNHLKVETDYVVAYYNWPYYLGGEMAGVDNETPGNYEDDFYGPSPLRSDDQIKKSIEREFFWSPFVDRDEITVTVHHSVAILAGKIGSWIAYHEAVVDAHQGGAAAVIVSKLEVKKGAWF